MTLRSRPAITGWRTLRLDSHSAGRFRSRSLDVSKHRRLASVKMRVAYKEIKYPWLRQTV